MSEEGRDTSKREANGPFQGHRRQPNLIKASDIPELHLNAVKATPKQKQICQQISDVEFEIHGLKAHITYVKQFINAQLTYLKDASKVSKHAELKQEFRQY
ncbi:hypothetical protein CDAR_230191 [Caerostris darwini]|uniref:Uncharacterized protein n=1 Tax=Caerostris darwini TaxID=1538125 RepID=A0AAV4MJ99_9ARAC|nr:hypothetical protein CDAR_230191 [Caerostris darwini]